MPRAPQTTILSIEAQRVVRADVFAAGATEPPRVLQQPRLGGAGLVESIRAALALAPGCARNVWVAASDIWSQTLTLPAAALAQLKDTELAAALAFEAEPLSGIPSIHAAMGFVAGAVRQDGMIDYAAIAMDVGTRDELQAVIAKAGGKLRGICCTKDLPAVLDDANQREWAERCAAAFQRTPPAIALIAPAPQKVSSLRYWVFGLLFEAAVLAVCFVGWNAASRAESDASHAAEALRAPRKQVEELRKKNDAAKAELKKLEDENARLAALMNGAEREVAFVRERIPAVLRGLAKERPSDVTILAIRAKDAQILTVDGLTLGADLADKYAAQLEAALAPSGLRVQPMSKTAQIVATNAGPWKFTLQIGASSDVSPLNSGATKKASRLGRH